MGDCVDEELANNTIDFLRRCQVHFFFDSMLFILNFVASVILEILA